MSAFIEFLRITPPVAFMLGFAAATFFWVGLLSWMAWAAFKPVKAKR